MQETVEGQSAAVPVVEVAAVIVFDVVVGLNEEWIVAFDGEN